MEYYALSNKLKQIGLTEDISSGIICRWRTQEGLQIDVMPTEAAILGFSNRWYRSAFQHSILHPLPSSRQIRIFMVAYLLAAKIEAFQGRGRGDFYGSTDLEDIMLLLDGRESLVNDLGVAPLEVRSYVSRWFQENLRTLSRNASAYLSPVSLETGRDERLLKLIRTIAQL